MCWVTPKVRFVACRCIRSHLTDFHAEEPLIIEDGSEDGCEDEAEAGIAPSDFNANIENQDASECGLTT